jgi:hypothetical protein
MKMKLSILNNKYIRTLSSLNVNQLKKGSILIKLKSNFDLYRLSEFIYLENVYKLNQINFKY